MKKLAIGCGIVLVIALVVGAVATYFIVNKVRSTVADVRSSVTGFTELGRIPEIERGVKNTMAFQPPDSGELTADQVSRYLSVQDQVRQTLGARVKEMDTKYKALLSRANRNETTALDMPELIRAYRDLAGLYVQAKRAQVDALNTAHFSLGEYRWIRQQSYLAIGYPMMNVDVGAMIDDAMAGRAPAQPQQTIPLPAGPAGPEKNKTLLAPHKKALEDNAALSFFGL
jgi:hypothetical protein